ncbi:MAG: hypothetical protein Q8M94_00970 [Ignavibacteria bacterium]|nr:hypothetical protein [Ignavibacteria bacterium]
MLFLTKCYFNPSGGGIEYFEKVLKVKNPTVFIFNKSLDGIKKVIEKELFIYNHTGGLFWKKDYPIYKELFNDSSNFNDYIKVRFRSDSKNYFSTNDTIPLSFLADFHIHLIKIDTDRTLVQVITYNSRLVTGEKTMGLVGEIGREIVEPVEPTSIEEYEILLKIGEALGVKEKMPPLLLP